MTRLEKALHTGETRTSPGGRDGASDGGASASRTLAGPVTPTRLMVGFVAAFLSVLTFQSGMIAILYAAGAPVPFAPWSMAPVPPFGVPQTLSAAFFGGLWGVAYAPLEPRLTARLGWWSGGLAFGALPLLVLWFVALPLKGLPVGGGFAPSGVLVGIVLHAVFGLATAIFFRFGPRLAGRRALLSPA
jgi:hypothetical protein